MRSARHRAIRPDRFKWLPRHTAAGSHRRTTLLGICRDRVIAATLSTVLAATVVTVIAAANAPDEPPTQEARSVVPGTSPTPSAAAGDPTAAPPINRDTPTAGANAVSASRTFSRPAAVDAADVPIVALAAYQRAQLIMEQADADCALTWDVLAGIGYVETNHGERGDSHLDARGRATPRIVSEPLNGRRGRPRIPDTDAGRIDGDRRFDRGVGPLMILPSTWSILAVDADGDAKRDPQNVNDAALAAAVYLCRGKGHLSSHGELRRALSFFNTAHGYAARVLAAAADYRTTRAAPKADEPVVARIAADPPPTQTTKSKHSKAPKPTHAPKPPKPTHAPKPPEAPEASSPTPTPSVPPSPSA